MTVTVMSRLKNAPKPLYFPVWSPVVDPFDWASVLVTYPALGSWSYTGEKPPFDRSKTVVMAESGGFLATGKPKDWRECLAIQLKSGAEICFTLDYPIKIQRSTLDKTTTQGLSNPLFETSDLNGNTLLLREPKVSAVSKISNLTYEEKMRLLQKNIQTAREEVKAKEWFSSKYEVDFELCPVIQGWDDKSMTYCATEYASFDDVSCYAQGVVTTDAATRGNSPATAVDAVVRAREIIGKDAWLHLLGVTQIEFLKLVKPYITSFDSATCIIDSRFGNLMLPSGEYISFKREGLNSVKRLLEFDIWKDSIKGKDVSEITVEDVSYRKWMGQYFKNYVEFLRNNFW